ncbi:MAG TPA: bifunctional proline dehydrogenase/L-glutamate gamma-semialdehyde dehydrogenase, partial [Candidatus Eisenbacteria bacterium]|nr:bifunctional proline dehydrogenase/L-glutamate gamma-semialdehyde dehydrogenase [Candidatus Eisenbacteria bacterium]
DMEEYRDMSLTAEAFMRTLDRTGLENISAGIVLQSYIPDSFRTQKQLNEWARRRVASGGAPITLRIVKGANLEMERVEAALKGWPQAPFKTKIETDANYKRMVCEGIKPENLAAVRLGIASHNLFELAYGLVLAAENNALDKVQFEMLEGMANHQRRALFELTRNMLLYAPVCQKKDFIHAIGYLIRRLDENTGPENFLRHAFKISVGSPEWILLEEGFLKSFAAIETLPETPRRTQNRLAREHSCSQQSSMAGGTVPVSGAVNHSNIAADRNVDRNVRAPPAQGWQHFVNGPDTDFSLPWNSEWAKQIIAKWQPRCEENAVKIPLVIDGLEIFPGNLEETERGEKSESLLPPHPSPLPQGEGERLAAHSRFRSLLIVHEQEKMPLHPKTEGRGEGERDVLTAERHSPPRMTRECLDPSRPGVVVARYVQATEADIDKAVACAIADEDGWRSMPVKARFELLGKVADELRRARAELIGAALANGGKTIAESDPEVSEAVDFVEFYRDTARWWGADFQSAGTTANQEREQFNVAAAEPKGGLEIRAPKPTLKAQPKGVVVVVSPWNFPIAIPCGGVAAALAAGNTVILKPASDTVLVAYELCQCFWRAGVSQKILQLLPCSGGQEGRRLVAHPQVNAVILTGGTATALAMLREKPDMTLLAETGGKNATIVTALADRDQAIKHTLHSAFSHSGQKCSATSLLLLEAEVYDDPDFKRALCDAVESIPVGSAWELKNKMGPLIRPPSGDLETALKVLEAGESWAVIPHRLGDDPNLWSPVVKWGVQPGSFTHMTEFFGPVLGVMRFEKLAEAIALVNQTGYGLTSGLESLDDREQEQWKAGIRAGNLYINRPTTGAIVLRQPFGGMGKSVFGPGIKAGGPNYVAQLMNFTDLGQPHSTGSIANPDLEKLRNQLERRLESPGNLPSGEIQKIVAAIGSYDKNYREEFARSHDHFCLLGQDNFRRYLPVRELRVRIHSNDTAFEIFARICAAKVAGCRITVSVPHDFKSAALSWLEELTEPWAGTIEFVEESDDELAEIIRTRQTDRIRYARPERVPPLIRSTVAETGLSVADAPVLMEGRVELLWYVQEQSISFDYHRYGNLGARAGEERAEVK